MNTSTYDFTTGKELLALCEEFQVTIAQAMLNRETALGEAATEQVLHRLQEAWTIMKEAAHTPIVSPRKSIGGLIGGEAQKLSQYNAVHNTLCGDLLSTALSYGLAVMEVNATMGLIVATPTAGSSGVVPGCLLALAEQYQLSEEQILNGLLHASAIGYIVMRNASVSGAEAGCQAEVGTASAMAASMLVDLLGGTPAMCLHAASTALSNLLGLACDPIAGLVEVPCQTRNAIGISNAFTCAQLALSGITYPIPFDEMVDAMYRVGRSLPHELRETALGGNATTPTGSCFNCNICS